MKLIRLKSNNVNETQFTAYLKDNVKIGPESEIALKSLSMDLQDKNIIVDNQNDVVTVQMGTVESDIINLSDEPKNVVIEQGTYTVPQLVQELTNKLNSVLSCPLIFEGVGALQGYERTDLGFQWKADVDITGELLIGFNRSDIVEAEVADCTLVNMEESDVANFFKTTITEPILDLYKNSVQWGDGLCKGGTRAKIEVRGQEAGNVVDNGDKINYGQFECGLVDSKFANAIIPEDFKLSVGTDFFRIDDQKYYKAEIGATQFEASVNDINQIEKGDYLLLKKKTGSYPVANTAPADIEITFNPIGNAALFESGDDIYIQYQELGIEKFIKRQVVAVNAAQGKILLNGYISAQNPCTNILAFKEGDNKYVKVIDVDILDVTLSDEIDTNGLVWFELNQNMIFYRDQQKNKTKIVNPDNNGRFFKLTSGTRFLFSRCNNNDAELVEIPCMKIQMIYWDEGGVEVNYNIYTEVIEGDVTYYNYVYAGISTAVDTAEDAGGNQLNLIYNIKGNNDPFTKTLEDGTVQEIPLKDMETTVDHKLKAINASIVTLTMTEASTRALLGFKNEQYTQNIISYKFVAEYPLLQNQVKEDVIVEIQNIPFDSYDSSRGGRQNAIYVLNRGEFESNVLDNRFDSKIIYPIYLGVANSIPMNLNQFNVRITTNGQSMKLKPNTDISLVLLVK